MDRTDVAIAGAGIIGLTTALELVAAGMRVTVFDQQEAMSEASRAAAGMLAATDPENPAELADLAHLSLRLYPEFLARVEQLSGKTIPIRTTRTVQGAHRLPDGIPRLTDAEVDELAPGANRGKCQFFLLEEKSFDAWDLAEALPTAVRATGTQLREHTPVLRVRRERPAVDIVTAAGTFSAGAFLNATGAWASALEPGLPVSPRKGHMLTVELPGHVQMESVLRAPEIYIIPRGAGRYTVGSTVEDVGFDRKVDPLRIQELLLRAADLWPPLRDATIAETWIGFRPGSPDGLPIIDQTSEDCWVATGHFKNGILLGPGTGRVVAQGILARQPAVDLSPFRLGRLVLSPVSS